MPQTDFKPDDCPSASTLAGVLNDAWRELVNERDPRVIGRTLTRPALARRIMQIVRRGERDLDRLKQDAKTN